METGGDLNQKLYNSYINVFNVQLLLLLLLVMVFAIRLVTRAFGLSVLVYIEWFGFEHPTNYCASLKFIPMWLICYHRIRTLFSPSHSFDFYFTLWFVLFILVYVDKHDVFSGCMQRKRDSCWVVYTPTETKTFAELHETKLSSPISST